MSRCSVELLAWTTAAVVPSPILTSVSPPLWLLSPSWSANRKREVGLGPGTLCCNACTWTSLLEQQNAKKKKKKYRTKNNCMHMQLDQILDPQNSKTKKSSWQLWGAWSKNRASGAKAEYGTHPLHSTPPRGWADHPSHPHPHPIQETSLPYHQGSCKQGKWASVLTTHCGCRGPRKALPEFLVWPLANFYSLGKAKNPVSNKSIILNAGILSLYS